MHIYINLIYTIGMKTIIIIGGLLISTAILAGIAFRIDTTQIYGQFQDTNGISTYKFKDGDITCYGSISKINGNVSTQAISCIK